MTTKNVNNIKAVYQLATVQEQVTGSAWYAQAREAALVISTTYDVPVTTVIGVIAALSPRNRWERNLIDAENIIEAYVTDHESAIHVKCCTFNNNKAKAIKILSDNNPTLDSVLDILSGPKLREFASCIFGLEDVCIDGHAYCIWNGGRTSLADVPSIGVKLRREIKADYIKAAKKLNVSPAVCQAITWCAWRRIHGVTAAA